MSLVPGNIWSFQLNGMPWKVEKHNVRKFLESNVFSTSRLSFYSNLCISVKFRGKLTSVYVHTACTSSVAFLTVGCGLQCCYTNHFSVLSIFFLHLFEMGVKLTQSEPHELWQVKMQQSWGTSNNVYMTSGVLRSWVSGSNLVNLVKYDLNSGKKISYHQLNWVDGSFDIRIRTFQEHK